MSDQADNQLTAQQNVMLETSQRHMLAEMTDDLETTMATMNANPHVYHIPVMTGGAGVDGVRDFYANHLVGKFLPPDTEFITLSRTLGTDQLVEEALARFTHSMMLDYMLPNVAPTGKRLEFAMVVIVKFDADGKIAYEHIYWDQASALVQLRLLDLAGLPVKRAESVQQLQTLANGNH